jgi:hypothetical protein
LIQKDRGRTVKDILDLNGVESLVSALQRHAMCVEVSCIVTPLLMLVLETLITSSAYLNHPVTGMSKDQRMKLLADQQDWKESVMKVSAPAVASLCTHQNDVKEYLEPVLNFMAEATNFNSGVSNINSNEVEFRQINTAF